MTPNIQTHGLRRLKDLPDLDVAEQDPDVRGWVVTSGHGEYIGSVDDLIVDTNVMNVRYLEVDLDRTLLSEGETRHVLVPIQGAQFDRTMKSVILTRPASDIVQLPAYTAEFGDEAVSNPVTSSTASSDQPSGTRLTRAEEELRVGKRRVETGEVVVAKHVETDHVSQPVTRTKERVTIERRPVTAQSGTATDLREDTIHIPIIEEELVVEKRTVIKEELVISKEVITESETVEADVRREQFDITSSDAEYVVDASAPTDARRGTRG
jgi:uncharacterized protein (TIGR02271 family)